MPKIIKSMCDYGYTLYPESKEGTCFYCDSPNDDRHDYLPPRTVVKSEALMSAWGVSERWIVPACASCLNRLSYHKFNLKSPVEKRMKIKNIIDVSSTREKKLLDRMQLSNLKPWEVRLQNGDIVEADDSILDEKALAAKIDHKRKLADVKPFDPSTDIADFGE